MKIYIATIPYPTLAHPPHTLCSSNEQPSKMATSTVQTKITQLTFSFVFKKRTETTQIELISRPKQQPQNEQRRQRSWQKINEDPR